MFNIEIQDGCQKWWENNFCKKSTGDSPHTQGVKSFDEITLKWQEIDFWEKSAVDPAATLWVKNLVEIDLSLSISEIIRFLRLMQKFKMAAKKVAEK